MLFSYSFIVTVLYNNSDNTTIIMKANVTKGAYHSHCRNIHNTKNLQLVNQFRPLKPHKIQRDIVPI